MKATVLVHHGEAEADPTPIFVWVSSAPTQTDIETAARGFLWGNKGADPDEVREADAQWDRDGLILTSEEAGWDESFGVHTGVPVGE